MSCMLAWPVALPVCTGQQRCSPPPLQVFDTQLLIARFDLDDYVWASITLYLDGAPHVVWESRSNAVQQWCLLNKGFFAPLGVLTRPLPACPSRCRAHLDSDQPLPVSTSPYSRWLPSLNCSFTLPQVLALLCPTDCASPPDPADTSCDCWGSSSVATRRCSSRPQPSSAHVPCCPDIAL